MQFQSFSARFGDFNRDWELSLVQTGLSAVEMCKHLFITARLIKKMLWTIFILFLFKIIQFMQSMILIKLGQYLADLMYLESFYHHFNYSVWSKNRSVSHLLQLKGTAHECWWSKKLLHIFISKYRANESNKIPI